jgi:hypothetical protein
MDKQQAASELLKIAKELVADEPDWQLEFPHHKGIEALDDIYRLLDGFGNRIRKSKDPKAIKAYRKLDKALRTYVTLLAQLKDAEAALY